MARPFKGTTFWDRVYAHVEQNGDCLEFTGCRDECGYGRINRDGKLVRLNREVWKEYNGSIPDGMVIRHTCDNRACINQNHLLIGRQADNVKDMEERGRRVTAVGSKQSQAKINESDVSVIRSRLASGATCVSLATEFNVSESLIRNIKKKRSWKHVP